MFRSESSSGRLQLATLVCITAAGIACSHLNFLKSPSVPKPRGDSLTVQGPAFGVAPSSAPDPNADWATYNRTFTGDRYAPFDGITTGNVGGLRPECSYKLNKKVTFQTGPLQVSGTIFFTTAASTYAIDASNCALRWRHDYQYQPKPDFDLGVNRGLAYLDGKLYRGSNDGRVYALDAATGRELWNVVAGNVKKGETFPAAPIAWNGLVFIGNAGGDNFGVVGRMMAF
jgi:alcohol dehydrogenase (cytochrome c)